jgi:hypothetical protein
MVTSALSGPRLQSPDVIGGIGCAVGGGGADVSVGNASDGVVVGPSAGGVLVLVGPTGEAVGDDAVHADRINAVDVTSNSRKDFGIREFFS